EHRRDLEMQTILVLTWFILFDDFSIGQKILNELAGYSKCQPCACTCTPLQHNADDFSIFKIIYGAPAGTWPRPFIDQYPLWPSDFYNIRISSDVSYRSDRDRSAERKSSKSDGRTPGCIAISNTTGTICLRGVATVHTARSNSFVLMHRLRKNRKNSPPRLAAPRIQPRAGRYKAGSGHGSARFGSSIASRT